MADRLQREPEKGVQEQKWVTAVAWGRRTAEEEVGELHGQAALDIAPGVQTDGPQGHVHSGSSASMDLAPSSE